MAGLFDYDPNAARSQSLFSALLASAPQLMAAGAPSTQPGSWGRGMAAFGPQFVNTQQGYMNSQQNMALRAMQMKKLQQEMAQEEAYKQMIVGASQPQAASGTSMFDNQGGQMLAPGPADPADGSQGGLFPQMQQTQAQQPSSIFGNIPPEMRPLYLEAGRKAGIGALLQNQQAQQLATANVARDDARFGAQEKRDASRDFAMEQRAEALAEINRTRDDARFASAEKLAAQREAERKKREDDLIENPPPSSNERILSTQSAAAAKKITGLIGNVEQTLKTADDVDLGALGAVRGAAQEAGGIAGDLFDYLGAKGASDWTKKATGYAIGEGGKRNPAPSKLKVIENELVTARMELLQASGKRVTEADKVNIRKLVGLQGLSSAAGVRERINEVLEEMRDEVKALNEKSQAYVRAKNVKTMSDEDLLRALGVR